MFKMFFEIHENLFPYLVGLIATVGLGIIVDLRLNAAIKGFRRTPPAGMTPENWATLLEWPETYGGVVHWLGLLERVCFYTAASLSMVLFVVGWLLFKLGCYWGLWHSLLRVRDRTSEMTGTDFMIVQSRRANAIAVVCVMGTLANLVVAFLGVFFFMQATNW